MDTLPFTYECARKQGDLQNLPYNNLVDCGKCVAEVINAKGKPVKNNKNCEMCLANIKTDKGKKSMDKLIDCCQTNIGITLAANKPKGFKGKPIPEEELDDFNHETLLPRMR